MNRKQWMILGLAFWIMMFLFIYIDLTWNLACNNSYSILGESPATTMDVTACVKAEVYAPFIWLSFVLANVFMICGWLEPKKKHQD